MCSTSILHRVSDLEICRYAVNGRMIVVSKDEAFFHLAARPGSEARLIWIRLGNCRTPELLEAIGKVWPRIKACLDAGDRIVEVR